MNKQQPISPDEARTLELIAQDITNAQIRERQRLTPEQFKTRIRQLKVKTGTKTIEELKKFTRSNYGKL